jgi:hypothetical protein
MSRVKVSNVQDARVMMELQKELVLDDSTRSCAKNKPLLWPHDALNMPRPISPVAIVLFAPLSLFPSLFVPFSSPALPRWIDVYTLLLPSWSTAAAGPEGRPLRRHVPWCAGRIWSSLPTTMRL